MLYCTFDREEARRVIRLVEVRAKESLHLPAHHPNQRRNDGIDIQLIFINWLIRQGSPAE